VASDPNDVRGAAAVVQVAVDGVTHVRALDEVAEGLAVLRPVRDERRLVDGASLRYADEGADRSANALDRTRAALHLLDVDAGRQVCGHGASWGGTSLRNRLARSVAAAHPGGNVRPARRAGSTSCPFGHHD